MTQVSVVIPAYNATSTLDRTLHSVRTQTHTNLEIIVVDDGSTDDTAALAGRHVEADSRISVVSEKNGGVAAARNRGIELATSSWVAPLDADDVWHPDTIANFLVAAEAAPEPVVFVYTWSRRIDEQDHLIADLGRPRYSGLVLNQIVASNFTRNASASMLDRSAVLQVGGYDSSFHTQGVQGAEDIDLYLRLARLGPVAVSEGYHVGYRQMSNSMSQSANRMRQSIEIALQKVEQADAKIDPALFSLARMNYDLYAGGLSFASGRFAELFKYICSAVARRPLHVFIYLVVLGPYSVIAKFRGQKEQVFVDLEPGRSYSLPVSDFIMSVQDRLISRLSDSRLVGDE